MNTNKKSTTEFEHGAKESSERQRGNKLDELFEGSSNNDQATEEDPEELEQQKKEAMTERD